MTILLFAGETYYPSGGVEDLVLVSNNLQEAKTKFAAISQSFEWANTYDTETKTKLRWDTFHNRAFDLNVYEAAGYTPEPSWETGDENFKWYRAVDKKLTQGSE